MATNDYSEVDEIPEVDRLQHYYEGVDAEAVEVLSSKYEGIADPERIAALPEVTTQFEDQAVIDERLGLESPSNVFGYSQGIENPAHVSKDHLEIPETVYHERLHQLSHPDSEQLLGTTLDEGITEQLALDALGVQEGDLLAPAYTNRTEIARELIAECNEDALLDAYFRGETDALEACLTERYGDGALERLRQGMHDWRDLREV